MSAPQFTPGPWSTNVSRLSDGSILVAHIVAEDGSAVAQLANHGEDRTIANLRMAATAPELYEALSELVETLRKEAPGTPLNNHRFDGLGIKANAALAKARGQ